MWTDAAGRTGGESRQRRKAHSEGLVRGHYALAPPVQDEKEKAWQSTEGQGRAAQSASSRAAGRPGREPAPPDWAGEEGRR